MLSSALRYAFNKTLQIVFNLHTSSRPTSTFQLSPKILNADEQSDDAPFYSRIPPNNNHRSAFKPQYVVPIRRPRSDAEAQRLYNHIRTVAWYLDAVPLLSTKLPFNIGIESIIGILPGIGDYLGLLLGLYQIYLCSLFGLPVAILLWMLLNVVIDCFIGLIPVVGDVFDVAFKANLRNLRYLEDHLHQSRGRCQAGTFYIQFPSGDGFIPAKSNHTFQTRPNPGGPVPLASTSSRATFPTISEARSRAQAPPTYYMNLPSSISSSANAAVAHAYTSHQHQGGNDEVAVDSYTIPEEAITETFVEIPHPSRSSSTDQDAVNTLHLNGYKVEANGQPPSPLRLGSPRLATSDHSRQCSQQAKIRFESLDVPAIDGGHGQGLAPGKTRPIRSCSVSPERPRVSWNRDADFSDQEPDGNEAQRLLKGLDVDLERNPNDAKATWRRRRNLYLIVYSAIFCVAYITSLDSNTGYLYLNFACSEYGALASFSTVAIVQQMVYAIAKPPIAKLSDVIGRPQAYVMSLTFYVSGYLIVATTTSLQSLIGGICLQSAGNTGVQVLQSIIIADTTTAKWRGLVIGIVNLPFLINFAVAGPMVDLVMQHGGWRFGFAIWTVLVPLSATPLLITLAVGQRRARRAGLAVKSRLSNRLWKDALRQIAKELDILGLLLFTGGWLLILLPLTLAGHGEGPAGLSTGSLILAGALLLLIFGWWETKAPVPILPYQFLTNPAVVCTCVVGILDFASFYISWTFLSSFIQILKGWDQTRTGYFATTQNVTSTITGIVVGSLMAMTRRYKSLLMGGLIIRLIGVTLMIRYRTAVDPTVMLVLCQLLQGIGGGSIAITMQVAVQVTVRHADVAIVTALELLTTEIGAAIGSATAGWMFQTYLPTKLAENLPEMDTGELEQIYGSLQKALSYPIGTRERTAIIDAWVEVMRMLSITATVMLVPAVLFGLAIPDTSLPDVHGSAHHHHHHHHHAHHHGLRKGDRRSDRRRSSILSTSRPSSPLEIRAAHSDVSLRYGYDPGVGKDDRRVRRDRSVGQRSRSLSQKRHKSVNDGSLGAHTDGKKKNKRCEL